jgi:hypothetical protein
VETKDGEVLVPKPDSGRVKVIEFQPKAVSWDLGVYGGVRGFRVDDVWKAKPIIGFSALVIKDRIKLPVITFGKDGPGFGAGVRLYSVIHLGMEYTTDWHLKGGTVSITATIGI